MLKLGPEICHVERCPHGCTSESGCRGTVSLLRAAQDVVDRWNTPLWKNAGSTADYIHRLREASERVEALAHREPPRDGVQHP